MNHKLVFLLLVTSLSFFLNYSFAQLPYGCDSSLRIAIAGDSWAQYMADDGTHNRTLKMYGHADKGAVSETFESPIGCSGSPGSNDYAVSGSEAREWVDETNYDYLQNLIDELNGNPSIDYVLLSIGGNDILAARSGGGWYKNMDLDDPGSEQALFDTITAHTLYIMNEVWDRASSEIKFIISSYDFPNFNVTGSFLGFDYCDQFACPKREDLSRDDNGNGDIDPAELITDAEINGMMDQVEGIRKDIADSHPNIYYDNSMGLMHYYYGYDDSDHPDFPAGTVDHPQGESPYATGGELSTPSDRENFRGVSLCGILGNFPADPIHLDEEGYQYKVKNQFDNILFENFRGLPDETFWSVGVEDGYVDVITGSSTTDGIRIGDNDTGFPFTLDNDYRGILSFNTESLPDEAVVTGASLYIIRSSENDNPFFHNDRNPVLDIRKGYFGDNPAIEGTDGTATADGNNIGCFHGQADEDKWAIRVDVEETALEYINTIGTTQLRMYFDYADFSPEYINFYDGAGVAALLEQDMEMRNTETKYKHRIVKQRTAPDGTVSEKIIEKGKPVVEKEGYVYHEKLKEQYTDDDGSVVSSFVLVEALEHPGLAKHMSDTYGAPADGYAPFLDITYTLPLPVELVAFTAVASEDRMSLLDWTTATEENNKGFWIEHSTDGKAWKALDFIYSSGNTDTEKQYNYIHEFPNQENNYYRLKVLDQDESFDYSEVRLVTFEKSDGLVNAFPNPFDDRLILSFIGETNNIIEITIYDVLGRMVTGRSVEVGANQETIQIDGLAKLPVGTYTLRAADGESIYFWKVVKR